MSSQFFFREKLSDFAYNGFARADGKCPDSRKKVLTAINKKRMGLINLISRRKLCFRRLRYLEQKMRTAIKKTVL